MSLRPTVFVPSVCLLLLGVTSALAQSAAPRETVSTRVGNAEVSIEYGRPALKGRNVSELMQKLPADRMWRAGSEQVTTLTTTAPVKLGEEVVPAGKYSLYLHCPEEGPYAVALNKVLGQPLKKIWDAAPPQLANELREGNWRAGSGTRTHDPIEQRSGRRLVHDNAHSEREFGRTEDGLGEPGLDPGPGSRRLEPSDSGGLLLLVSKQEPHASIDAPCGAS